MKRPVTLYAILTGDTSFERKGAMTTKTHYESRFLRNRNPVTACGMVVNPEPLPEEWGYWVIGAKGRYWKKLTVRHPVIATPGERTTCRKCLRSPDRYEPSAAKEITK